MTMGRMFRGLEARHKRRARSTICHATTFDRLIWPLPPTHPYRVGSLTGVIVSKEIPNLHPMALTLAIGRCSGTEASSEGGSQLSVTGI